MPKAPILYFSTTGNTKLACEYLANRIPQFDFDLSDINETDVREIPDGEAIGFACYCDFQGVPMKMLRFMESLPPARGKPAFILITYAAIQGRTMKKMKEILEKKGFTVLSGHALRMPENYSPLRKRGMTGDDRPKEDDLEEFRNYIRSLSDDLVAHSLGKRVEPKRIKIGLLNWFFRGNDRKKAKKEMGEKKVDRELCIRCGKCQEECPYHAISLDPVPIFNEKNCMGCFSCYNHCPVGAISTSKLTSDYRYPGPSEELKKKMSY